jgi:hypothetical protein
MGGLRCFHPFKIVHIVQERPFVVIKKCDENVLGLEERVEEEMSREKGTLVRTVNGDGCAML